MCLVNHQIIHTYVHTYVHMYIRTYICTYGVGVVVICLTVTQTNGTGISDNVSSQSPDPRAEYSDLRTYVCIPMPLVRFLKKKYKETISPLS